MKQQRGWIPCLGLMICFVLAGTCMGVEIPGTACTITPPSGWQTTPGTQGSVMNFNAPDGLATISVNVIPVQEGVTPAQFMQVILDSVTASMAQDEASGWQVTSDKTTTSHGLPVTIRTYHPSKSPAMGDLIMSFSQGSTCVFLLNIAIGVPVRQQYEPLAVACAKSIKDPALKETSVTTGNTVSPVKSKGKVSEVRECLQFTPAQLEEIDKKLVEQLEQDSQNQEYLTALAAIRAGMAIKLNQAGQLKRAIDFLTSAVQIDGTCTDLLELLGDMLDDLDEPSAPYLAQSYYEDALALDPSLTACRTKLASSYMSKSEFSDARVHYEYLTSHGGDKPADTHIQQLVLCYVSLGCEEEGMAFLRKMKEKGGGAQTHIALAVLLNQTGSTEEAVVVLK